MINQIWRHLQAPVEDPQCSLCSANVVFLLLAFTRFFTLEPCLPNNHIQVGCSAATRPAAPAWGLLLLNVTHLKVAHPFLESPSFVLLWCPRSLYPELLPLRIFFFCPLLKFWGWYPQVSSGAPCLPYINPISGLIYVQSFCHGIYANPKSHFQVSITHFRSPCYILECKQNQTAKIPSGFACNVLLPHVLRATQ